MGHENFLDLDITFAKWLQFADLNKQLENIYEIENEISEEYKTDYRNRLKEISNILLNKHPFDI
jgi:hypothetical protein